MRRERPDGAIAVAAVTARRYGAAPPMALLHPVDTPDAELLAAEPLARHELGATKVTGVSVIVSELKAAQYLYGEQLGLKYEGWAHDTQARRLHAILGHFRVELMAHAPDRC